MHQKEVNRKKLELTIKSHSQRILKYHDNDSQIRPQNMQIELNTIDKTKSSCLLLTNKFKRERKVSDASININHSESFLETKRRPLAPRLIINEENQQTSSETKGKPRFAGEAKVIELKMKMRETEKEERSREREVKSRERKTFQHISSKRPPFVELKSAKQFRSSFDLKYRY
jgi:hypothetical protein